MPIEKEKFYSMSEIQEQRLIPTARTLYKIRNYIKKNKLKALIENDGIGVRYKIKGVWILDFIEKLESGKL